MTKQITLRNPSMALVTTLRELAARRSESLNTTILRVLEEALGVDERAQRLQRYATWTQQDLCEFDETLKQQRVIDEKLWR